MYSWAITPASKSPSRSGGSGPLVLAFSRTVAVSGRFALIALPACWETMTDGIRVTPFGSTVGGVVAVLRAAMLIGLPGALFETMAAIAPAFSAFFTFTAKLQFPR